MGRIKFLLFSILLLILLNTAKVFAAPSEWGIAINESKKECAGYWAGDEFSFYTLPDGWESYTPDYDEIRGTYIKTPYGICDFSNHSEQDCCEQLSLPYVSNQIGEYSSTGLCLDCFDQEEFYPLILIVLVCCCFSLLIGGVVLIFLLKNKKHNN